MYEEHLNKKYNEWTIVKFSHKDKHNHGNSEQLSYFQRCRIRYHFADVSKMVGGCFRFGNNHSAICR